MVQKLSGDYVAGFTDGEGCFALKYRLDKQQNKNGTAREYYYWGAEFAIVLHPLDFKLLELIQQTLGVGKISYKKTGDQVRYSVQNTSELKETIIPFFEKYPLKGIKAKDFKLWSDAVKLISSHKSKEQTGRTKPIEKETQIKLEKLKSLITKEKRRGREI